MELTSEKINAILREFITTNFLLGYPGTLSDQDSFLDSGIVDSTGILEFVGFLEEKWGITVADEELLPENFDTLERLTAFVVRKGPKSGAV